MTASGRALVRGLRGPWMIWPGRFIGTRARIVARLLHTPVQWASVMTTSVFVGVAAAGSFAKGYFDLPLLRLMVAITSGALAATVAICERWAAAPESPARGLAAGAVAGSLVAMISL